MRYPDFLKDNGTIGFVAPSYGCSIEPYRTCFESALEKFRELGYKTDLGPNCYESKGIGISNTPYECGRELTDYYCSADNDVLISCGGGELMCETIDYVDFEKIRMATPKWYMGYSDNTNFTFLLTTLCDTASIYGPCAASFGMKPWDKSIKDAFDILTGRITSVRGYDMWEKESFKDETNPLTPYNLTETKKLHIVAESDNIRFEGRLLGGCLDCLINIAGTGFDRVAEFNEKYKNDGIIWFLEACDLNVMSIRRALWQLEHAGWFKYVRGFVIGRPLCFGEEAFGMDQYTAVTGVLEKYKVPIIMDADLGHLPPMMPLICGAKAETVISGGNINIKYQIGI